MFDTIKQTVNVDSKCLDMQGHFIRITFRPFYII